jgi:hypothetical protein
VIEPDLKDLWQSQATQEGPMTVEQIRTRATCFQSRIRIRNLIEYLAIPVVLAGYGKMAWDATEPMTRIGAIMVMLGALVLGWQLHVRGGARRAPAASATAVMDFHRAELVRQRDALSTVWLWYLGPLVPGLAVILASWWLHPRLSATRDLAQARTGLLITIAICIAVFAAVLWLNNRGARRLQKMIDDLDALTRG